MRKRLFMVTALCAASLLAGCSSTPADTASSPAMSAARWKIERDAGGLIIAGYTGSDTKITIPASIRGLPVIGIGRNAFAMSQLTSVTIPNSVTSIAEYAFYNTPLVSVTMGNHLSTIGEGAFQSTHLTSVTFPNSLTIIGAQAFAKTQLTRVTFPNSVTSIGDRAFYEAPLTSVTLPNSVTFIGERAFASSVEIIRL